MSTWTRFAQRDGAQNDVHLAPSSHSRNLPTHTPAGETDDSNQATSPIVTSPTRAINRPNPNMFSFVSSVAIPVH